MTNPEKILEEMLATFKERGKIYGHNYLKLGKIISTLYPKGVNFATAKGYDRFAILVLILVKVTRLAEQGLDHKDSAIDLGVYAAMLASLCHGAEPDFQGAREVLEGKMARGQSPGSKPTMTMDEFWARHEKSLNEIYLAYVRSSLHSAPPIPKTLEPSDPLQLDGGGAGGPKDD